MEHLKDLKLLYAEDDEESAFATKLFLEDFFQKVDHVQDGEEALNKLQKEHYDMILTDVTMPKIDGLELCKEAKEIDEDIVCVVLGAHNERSFLQRAVEIGVDGYIFKPLDMQKLLREILRVAKKYHYKKEAQEYKHLARQYYDAINKSAIVSKTDINGKITEVNDEFIKLSKYDRQELIGRAHNIVRHPDMPKEVFKDMWHTIKEQKRPWRGLVKNRAKDGSSYYVYSHILPIHDQKGGIKEFLSIRYEVTDFLDQKRMLLDEIRAAEYKALVMMSIDKVEELFELFSYEEFKWIEQRVGSFLDEIISQFVSFERLYSLGDGEYAFLVDQRPFKKKKEFLRVLKSIQQTIDERRVKIDQISYDIKILMSVAFEKTRLYDYGKLGINYLLKSNKNFIVADYRAKKLRKKAHENKKMLELIRRAIKESRVICYFQPIIDNQTQKIVKVESLVRIVFEDRVISPFFFLDVAKKSDYYYAITKEMLRQSFKLLRKTGLPISLNLSFWDIEEKETRELLLHYLHISKDLSSKVTIELLEDEESRHFGLIQEFITELKSYGVQIAIDDFGSGYSSYERLLEFQPDILKIDGSLVKNIDTNSYSHSIVKSVVTFAKEQNLKTVAEFIENEKIFSIIKDLGVDYSQGYYFGKPEPIERFLQ